MSSTSLSAEQMRFIEDLAELLGAWSLSPNAARLYGYLQIMNEPVSLDDISRDLEISRSHAHTAARTLESHGNAKAVPTRGSKRILYVCGDDPGTPLRRQVATLGRMADLITSVGARVAENDAGKRLAQLGAFHGRLKVAMQEVIDPASDGDA